MLKLVQLFRDLNAYINSPEFIEKRKQVSTALRTIADWIDGEDQTVFGEADQEAQFNEAVGQITEFIYSQGGSVPSQAAGEDRRAYILELIKIAVSLLLKTL